MKLAMREKLKEVFGYDAFRPLQEEIITDALAGRDVFALLPTGGGKSLCYQMPALLVDGLTLVVSPLIALMKDQVDALVANGVAATFLNSTLTADESRRRLRGLHAGEYRLLYMAPERLLLDGVLGDLRTWGVRLVAIDEAHCISEWGHDFRPEYRRLAEFRQSLPDAAVMALTATATDRVRRDIVELLKLREPTVYVASFNRENLLYRVTPKGSGYAQVRDFARSREKESGIVYCSSRKLTESLAGRLRADGITALPYHAGLEAEERGRNQDAFLRDEARVICATIAFGMGIDKPNVRFVLHHDLPASIESYYQQTGRAGRDGLPSECVLLYGRGDILKQKRFLEEKEEAEREVGQRQLDQLVGFVEGPECRRRALLRYFGEEYPEENCGACDNCLAPREEADATVAAQKFLSCIYRVKQASGWSFGVNHVIEVLTGAKTKGVLDRGHDRLPTYGIGADLPSAEWKHLANELIRLGLAARSTDKYATVDLTPEGLAALKDRRTIAVTKAATQEKQRRRTQSDIGCDEGLFEALRGLRRELAAARSVPAYVIFSDVALRHLARSYPASEAEFRAVPGVGDRKADEFAEVVLARIAEHVAAHGRQEFAPIAAGVAASVPRRDVTAGDSARETARLFRDGRSVPEIAAERGLKPGTVLSHLLTAWRDGVDVDLESLVPSELRTEIEEAFRNEPRTPLGEVKESCSDAVLYDHLHVVRALLEGRVAAEA